MSFEYEWNKEDLKKELINKRKRANVIFFILGILMYIYFTYYAIISKMFDNKYIFAFGLGYVSILGAVLLISTKLYISYSLKKNDKKTSNAYGIYKVVLNDDSINVSVNDININYKYSDISKFKKNKKQFFICTKDDKIGLLFKKKVIGAEKYKELLEYIEKNIH